MARSQRERRYIARQSQRFKKWCGCNTRNIRAGISREQVFSFSPFFSSSKITECGRLRVLQFHLEFLTCQCKMLSEKNSSQVVERIPNVVSSIDIINVHSEHCIVFISFLCNFEAESRAPNA